ncbi:MAG: STAS/SEC14 domain-containing protein [Polyangiaceae bacterium]|nr:STAS/SEC14 domain-containing protein [Polyangiaceae bacterium]
MLELTTDKTAGVLEVTVDGDIDRADFEAAVKAIDELIAQHPRIKAVEVVRRIGKISPGLWWRDLNYTFSHLNKFGRCAVVTDKGWIGPLARFFAAVSHMEIRTFPMTDLEGARAWVRETSQ